MTGPQDMASPRPNRAAETRAGELKIAGNTSMKNKKLDMIKQMPTCGSSSVASVLGPKAPEIYQVEHPRAITVHAKLRTVLAESMGHPATLAVL